MMDTNRPWYSSVEAQQAFLALPEDDQITLELKYRVEADAMHIIYNARIARNNLSWERSIFLETVDGLEPLSTRAKTVLRENNIYYIGQLACLPDPMRLMNAGGKTAQELHYVLEGFGLTFWTTIPEEDIESFIATFRNEHAENKKYAEKLDYSNLWTAIGTYFSPLSDRRNAYYNSSLNAILQSHQIYYYGQIAHFTDEELKSIPNMTQEAMDDLNKIKEEFMIMPLSKLIPEEYLSSISKGIYLSKSRLERNLIDAIHISIMINNWLKAQIPHDVLVSFAKEQIRNFHFK